MQPEAPVDGDVENQVDIIACSEIEMLKIVERRDDQPRREDAQQAAFVEGFERGLLGP